MALRPASQVPRRDFGLYLTLWEELSVWPRYRLRNPDASQFPALRPFRTEGPKTWWEPRGPCKQPPRWQRLTIRRWLHGAT